MSDASAATPSLAAPAPLLPRAPAPALLWQRALRLVSILVAILALDVLAEVLARYWLLDGMGLVSVFWTDFRQVAWLALSAFVGFMAAILTPAFGHPLTAELRRRRIEMAVVGAAVAAYYLSLNYSMFLLTGDLAVPFGKTDPVFGHDLGFYVYNLDNLWVAWRYTFLATCVFLALSIHDAWASREERPARPGGPTGVARILGIVGTRTTQVGLGIWGFVAAAGVWLRRYDLLYKDNSSSSVWTGAEALDVTGFFSNLNYVYLTTFLMLVDDVVLIAILIALRRAYRGDESSRVRSPLRALIYTYLLLAAVDFSFKGLVEVRNWVAIKPNEPVVQLEFIRRNLEATRAAFHLDKATEIPLRPKGPGDPPPDVERLLASETVRQAPLWPGFSSYLERDLDIQHANRIFQTGGDPMIYGPTLEVFRQQQQLRTYYDFVGVDTVRYPIGGRKQMLVSAVREAPLMEPSPWLAYWGQRFMLFTHGHGLVMAPVAASDRQGSPQYASFNIPGQTSDPALQVENPRVYYGEGSATMAFSNVGKMKELDYPTEQGRAEIFLPVDYPGGVKVDSFLKRLVFGWRSDRFFEIVFSDLIESGTRIHFFRTPLERLGQAAPFLYLDPNAYAVAADGGIQWIVNGMTVSDRYPYSWPGELGDKSDNRSPFPKVERIVNYVEDSVKATVDAYTGQPRLYRISDEPLVRTWSNIYPALFTAGAAMPASIRRQVTYPLHLFHLQFDDHYVYYHQNDPMYFFNMEDMWDDSDDVMGPMLDFGEAITFSIEPYYVMLEGLEPLPAPRETPQFAMMAVFTPESALNLRAMPIVYQDGEDYGKLVVLTVPKGHYVPGPEQADAAIDQDPQISQFFAWWNRRGMEIVRGHTVALPVGDEVLYVEPIFLRSQQQPVTQLKKVAVVYRGHPVMADTLDEALRLAISGGDTTAAPIAPPLVATEGTR